MMGKHDDNTVVSHGIQPKHAPYRKMGLLLTILLPSARVWNFLRILEFQNTQRCDQIFLQQ